MIGARDDINAAAEAAPTAFEAEWLTEAADMEAWFGNAEAARTLLDDIPDAWVARTLSNLAKTIAVRLQIREGQRCGRMARCRGVSNSVNRVINPDFGSRQLAIRAHAALAAGVPDFGAALERAICTPNAKEQGSGFATRETLKALTDSSGAALNALLRRTADSDMWTTDAFAEEVCAHLANLDDSARNVVGDHCARRPERWLPALRRVVEDDRAPSRWTAGEILDQIGATEDIPRLRNLARTTRAAPGRMLGRALARRLAPRIRHPGSRTR